MSLESLHKVISKTKSIHQIIEAIELLDTNHGCLSINGIIGSFASLIISHIQSQKTDSRILFICKDDTSAKEHFYDFTALSKNNRIIQFTHVENSLRLQSDDLDEETINNVDSLAALQAEDSAIIIATPDIFNFYLPTPKELLESTVRLSKDKTISFKDFTNSMMFQGFERRDLVENQGDISIRGGIVDIFPLGFDAPLRIEFWGDTIDSIREFDPISQRSIREMDHAEFVAHLYHQQEKEFTASILDYLPLEKTYIVFEDYNYAMQIIKKTISTSINQYKRISFNNNNQDSITIQCIEQPNFSSSYLQMQVYEALKQIVILKN